MSTELMLDSLISSMDRTMVVGGGGKPMKKNARSYSSMTVQEWADCSDSDTDSDSTGHTDEESDEDVRLTMRQKRCKRLLDDVFSAGVGLGLDLVEFAFPEPQLPASTKLTWRIVGEISESQSEQQQQHRGQPAQPEEATAQ